MRKSKFYLIVLATILLLLTLAICANAQDKPVVQDSIKAERVNLSKDEIGILLFFYNGAQFSGNEIDLVSPVIGKLRTVLADTSKARKPLMLSAVEKNVLAAVIERSELKKKLQGK